MYGIYRTNTMESDRKQAMANRGWQIGRTPRNPGAAPVRSLICPTIPIFHHSNLPSFRSLPPLATSHGASAPNKANSGRLGRSAGPIMQNKANFKEPGRMLTGFQKEVYEKKADSAVGKTKPIGRACRGPVRASGRPPKKRLTASIQIGPIVQNKPNLHGGGFALNFVQRKAYGPK